MIYNRQSKATYEDLQYGGKYLNFLYNSFLGRIFLKLIINPIISKIYGKYNNTSMSKKKIDTFIKKYNIDINEYEKKRI